MAGKPEATAAPARAILEEYRRRGFRNEEELLNFIAAFWGVHIPRARVCPEHTPPAYYIVDAFFERVQDCIVWASRSGGKTFSGALITWLDSVFKDFCQTKILGGSREQSERMYEHLTGEREGVGLITRDFFHLVDGEVLTTRTKLVNKSNIQILTASTRSVRGPHPQKLKLDEVDEVDSRIYEAALLIPKTARGIRASRHIYSTMHRPFGLMQQIITNSARAGYKVYKWCIFDVMERCEGRDCQGCELWDDCGGRARQADGFYSIEDAISIKRKVSPQTWACEALCQIPSQEDLIYPDFDPVVHIV